MTWKLVLRRKVAKSASIKSSYTVLGMDPGEKNYFYSVIRDGKLIGSGQVKSSINKVDMQLLFVFEDEITELVCKYRPDFIVCERMMVRRFLNKMVETVTYMLGSVRKVALSNNARFDVITASQWKLSIKKCLDLNELYKFAKKQHKLPPHVIDSALIARYHLSGNNFHPNDKQWIYNNLINLAKGSNV